MEHSFAHHKSTQGKQQSNGRADPANRVMNASMERRLVPMRGRWLLVVISLAAGLVTLISGAGIWWSNFTNAQGNVIDFLSLYTGGALLWQDRAHLYDLERQLTIEASILAPYTLPGGVLPYNYPPFVALLLVPLAWLPFPLAYATATALNLFCLAITLHLLQRRLALGSDQTYWLLLAVFCSTAVYVTLLQGQTSLLALLLLALHVLDLQQGRETRAGVWVGLLLFKPQLLPLPLLILVWRRQWRVLLTSAIVLVVLSLLSVVLVGVEGLRQHVLLTQRMTVADGTLGIHPLVMHNVRALAHFMFLKPWDSVLWWGTSALVALATLWAHRSSPQYDRSFAWCWSATVIALLLLSPHLNTHDLALLILPYALILSSCGGDTPALMVTALVSLSISPLLTAALWTASGVNWPVMPVVLIALFLVCLWQSSRRSLHQNNQAAPAHA